MTGRALRVELRRGAAPALAVTLAVVGGLLLFLRPDEWHARWLGLAMTFRNDLAVLVPLALAAGVWQAGREHRSGVGELHASTGLPQWRAALPAGAAVVLGAVAGGAGVLLAGAALVAPAASWISADFLVVALTGLIVLLAAALLGVALGRVVTHVVAAPVALLVSVVALLWFQTAGAARERFSPVLEPPSFDALAPVAGFLAAQFAFFVLLAVGAAGLAFATTRGARLLAVPPVLGGVVLALTLSGGAEAETFRVDRDAAAPVCATGTPRVCVIAVHASALPALAAPMQRTLRELQARFGGAWEAVEAPDSESAARHAIARRVPFTISGSDLELDGAVGFRGDGPRTFAASLASDLATGRSDACAFEQPSGRLAAYAFGQKLLLDVPGPPTDRQGNPVTAAVARDVRAALARLRELPAAEQPRALTEIRRGYIACEADPLEALR